MKTPHPGHTGRPTAASSSSLPSLMTGADDLLRLPAGTAEAERLRLWGKNGRGRRQGGGAGGERRRKGRRAAAAAGIGRRGLAAIRETGSCSGEEDRTYCRSVPSNFLLEKSVGNLFLGCFFLYFFLCVGESSRTLGVIIITYMILSILRMLEKKHLEL